MNIKLIIIPFSRQEYLGIYSFNNCKSDGTIVQLRRMKPGDSLGWSH